MRLILLDQLTPKRRNFHPLALSRPIFGLRCGMTSLGAKLAARTSAVDVACFVPPYMADVCRQRTAWPVNDVRCLAGDDLFLVNSRVKAAELSTAATGPSEAVFDGDGEPLYLRVAKGDLSRLDATSIESFVETARTALPHGRREISTWTYTWEFILANPKQLVEDFAAAGEAASRAWSSSPAPPRQRQGRVCCARRFGPPDGCDRRRQRSRSISKKGRRSIPSPASKGRVTSARSRSFWEPSAAKATRSAPCAGWEARWRSRSSRATRTSITTASSATLTWASGSISGP